MSRPKVFLVAVAVLGAFLALRFLPIAPALDGLVRWIRDAGVIGVAVYAVLYLVASIALIPVLPLTLAAGFLWGPIWGTLLVSPCSVLGATLAFLVGRSLARAWVARMVEGNARFAAIDRAIGASGFKVVTLLRMSPVLPFVLLNYALAVTRVRWRDFVLGSALGMLPGTFLYVYLGSLIGNVADLLAGKTPPSAGKQVLLVAGLGATVVVTVLVTRAASAALARADVSTGTSVTEARS